MKKATEQKIREHIERSNSDDTGKIKQYDGIPLTKDYNPGYIDSLNPDLEEVAGYFPEEYQNDAEKDVFKAEIFEFIKKENEEKAAAMNAFFSFGR